MTSGPPTGTPAQLIAWLAPMARQAQRLTGIPASLAIAQALLESDGDLSQGYAPSWLATHAHNLYGMTAGDGTPTRYWDGQTVERNGRAWRKYRTYQQAVMDWALLFYRVGAYAPALAYRTQPLVFASIIVPTYAPGSDGNTGYLATVTALFNQYQLGQYDVPPDQWTLDTRLVPAHYVDTWRASLAATA